MISAALERRLLQFTIAVAGLVPVGGGGWGALGRWHDDSHSRFLSGLLLGIGLTFWWTIPTIERRGAIVRGLAVIVVIGGLARLAVVIQHGSSPTLPLAMELLVTPLIALWRERVERRMGSPVMVSPG